MEESEKTIEDLPDEMLRSIFLLVGHPAPIVLTCKRWCACAGEMRPHPSLDWLLCDAATDGHIALIDLYHEWGADNAKEALCCASAAGQIGAMQKFRWNGWLYYDDALVSASKDGNIRAIEELIEWGARDIDRAMESAAAEDESEMMDDLYSLALKLGVTADPDRALRAAAARGALGSMWKLWGMGAIQYDHALYAAAKNDENRAIDHLLGAMHEFERPEFHPRVLGKALRVAASGMDYVRAVEMLLRCGAPLSDRALYKAVKSDSVEVMQILLKWGVGGVNEALVLAARFGKIRAMEKLREWEATDFETALLHCADYYGIPDQHVTSTLKQWIRERDGAKRECPIDDSSPRKAHRTEE